MIFEAVFNDIKDQLMKADVSKIKDFFAIQVNLIGFGGGVFYVKHENGKLFVEPYEYFDRNTLIMLSINNLKLIADEKLDPVEAYKEGKIVIEGDLNKALDLITIIKSTKN